MALGYGPTVAGLVFVVITRLQGLKVVVDGLAYLYAAFRIKSRVRSIPDLDLDVTVAVLVPIYKEDFDIVKPGADVKNKHAPTRTGWAGSKPSKRLQQAPKRPQKPPNEPSERPPPHQDLPRKRFIPAATLCNFPFLGGFVGAETAAWQKASGASLLRMFPSTRSRPKFVRNLGLAIFLVACEMFHWGPQVLQQ